MPKDLKNMHSYVWERTESPRFLTIRLEILQLLDYDEQAAKVASVLITRHNLLVKHLNGEGCSDDPWFTMTRNAIRAWCLGMIGFRSIDKSLDKILTLGFLAKRDGEGLYSTTSYLVDAEALNELLKNLPADPEGLKIPGPETQPNKRMGWEAAQEKSRLRKIADGLAQNCDPSCADLRPELRRFADNKADSLADSLSGIIEAEAPIPVKAISEEQTPLLEELSVEEESLVPLDISFDNNFDWVDNLVRGHGKSLGARPLEKEMTAFDALVNKLGGPEATARLYVESEDRSLSAFIKSHGGFAAKSKSARTPAPQQQRISRNSASVTQRGRPSYSTQPSASNAQKQESGHTPETAAAVARWNELVPAKAVTLTGSVKGYSVDLLKGLCQDEEFMQGFDTICKKAAAQGPWCNFGWLPFDKQDGKGPNWGKLLRGELDGLGSAGGGFKANKFSRDSLRATAEADIARRAQL